MNTLSLPIQKTRAYFQQIPGVGLNVVIERAAEERRPRHFLFSQGLKIRAALWQVFQSQPSFQRKSFSAIKSFQPMKLGLLGDFENRL